MATINRTWFANKLKQVKLLVKCNGKYTDDYSFDNSTGFSREKEFSVAKPDLFSDWYLSIIRIYGDKENIINVVFASCEYYEFKLNPDVK